jgi:hypothetical protein
MYHMKTTVEIADSLFAEARSTARTHGLTLRQLIETGLRYSIARHRSRPEPFHLKDGSFRGSGLQAPMSWERLRGAIYEGRGE